MFTGSILAISVYSGLISDVTLISHMYSGLNSDVLLVMAKQKSGASAEDITHPYDSMMHSNI